MLTKLLIPIYFDLIVKCIFLNLNSLKHRFIPIAYKEKNCERKINNSLIKGFVISYFNFQWNQPKNNKLLLMENQRNIMLRF